MGRGCVSRAAAAWLGCEVAAAGIERGDRGERERERGEREGDLWSQSLLSPAAT